MSADVLISFVLVGHNQERYIKEAVNGALSQTYSPLEVVLSDDCSTDNTYEIMRELAAAYHGPHKIVVNRNSRNSGSLPAHLNAIIPLLRGKLVVIAAGDDVSLPERTEWCHRAWIDSGRRASSIWSDYMVIDEFGEILGYSDRQSGGRGFEHVQVCPIDVAAWRAQTAYGCTQAWCADVLNEFGHLPGCKYLVNEDTPIFFRAAILSGLVTRIKKPLVKYRRHKANISLGFVIANAPSASDNNSVAVAELRLKRLMAVAKCFRKDARLAINKGLYLGDGRRLRREIARSYRAFQLRAWLLKASYRDTLKIAWRLALLGRGRKYALRLLVRTIQSRIHH